MNWGALVWLVLLLFANGFFVAAEFAYITARRDVVAQRQGRSATLAVGLSRDLSLSLAGAQLGITMASLVLGAVAEPAIAGMLELALGFLGLPEATLHAIALVIALLIVVFLHMVVGEMAPKNVAISHPETSAVALAIPFRAFIFMFRPLIALLNGIANGVLRLLRVEPVTALEHGHTAEDLAVVIGAGQEEGVIGDFAHTLLTGAITFNDRDAADVMTPRPDMVLARRDAPIEEILELMKATGHSRIPLYEGSVDDIKGFAHVKDLIQVEPDRRRLSMPPDLVREAVAVPESASLRSVLARMRAVPSHLGIVVDEHGSAAGLVTMEDVAEELIGEIVDEYDPVARQVRKLAGGQMVVPGNARIDELSDIGLQLPDGEYTTIGGLIMERLGRIPKAGDQVEEAGWSLSVRSVSRRRVDLVVASPVADEAVGSDGPS